MLNRPQLSLTCGQRSREQMDSALGWRATNLVMYKYRLDCSAQYDAMLAFLAVHPTDEDFCAWLNRQTGDSYRELADQISRGEFDVK